MSETKQNTSLTQAINDMRTMRESYDQLGAAAEAYNTGKVQLAQNITSKGVPASANETLPELAEKVSAIMQESYTIDGGEMYAKQLFGVANNDIVPGYWNLYEIMAQLLSDGRLVNYGGILLAEYYKGYDSLALSGAGAGGAYVVSDKDGDGNFIMYTEDTTHIWDTKDDGKGNRWVAYCFADAGHDFDITDTNTCPRSIHIGRSVGKITSLVNGRVSEIVVTDGNTLGAFDSRTYTQNWNKSVVLRLDKIDGNVLYEANSETIYASFKQYVSGMLYYHLPGANTNIIVDGNGCEAVFSNNLRFITGSNGNILGTSTINYIHLKNFSLLKGGGYPFAGFYCHGNVVLDVEEYDCDLFFHCSIDKVIFHNIEKYLSGRNFIYGETPYYMLLEYKDNDKSRVVKISYDRANDRTTDIELKAGWCKPLNISIFSLLTKQNVQAHIFDRLGVNDISTGSVTITLASAVLALFTQEEIDAVVARTNITIVGA